VGIREALAPEVRHRVGLAPHDVVEDPEVEILQGRADPEDVVIGPDHPKGGVPLHHAAHGEQPGAGERIVGREARELVPVVVDGVDHAVVGTHEGALELKVVGWIREDEVHALGRQALEGGDAIADDDFVERKGRNPHPRRRRDPPGTRDLNPGGSAGGPGTRGTHGHSPVTQLTRMIMVR
jgi:hypothetical protein